MGKEPKPKIKKWFRTRQSIVLFFVMYFYKIFSIALKSLKSYNLKNFNDIRRM